MKKLIAFLYIAIFIFTSLSPAYANAQTITLKINDQPINSDVPPLMVNSRTLVPVRVVSEYLGAEVKWNQEDKSITISGDNELKLQLNKNNAYVNDDPLTLDSPPLLVSERTMVPIRFISEGLGCDVSWDGPSKTVAINKQIKKVEKVPLESSNAMKDESSEEANSGKAQHPTIAGETSLLEIGLMSERGSEGLYIQFDKDTEYSAFALTKPHRYVIDCKDTVFRWDDDELNIDKGNIISVRAAQNTANPPMSRIVLDLKDKDTPNIIQQDPHRLVIWLGNAPPTESETKARAENEIKEVTIDGEENENATTEDEDETIDGVENVQAEIHLDTMTINKRDVVVISSDKEIEDYELQPSESLKTRYEMQLNDISIKQLKTLQLDSETINKIIALPSGQETKLLIDMTKEGLEPEVKRLSSRELAIFLNEPLYEVKSSVTASLPQILFKDLSEDYVIEEVKREVIEEPIAGNIYTTNPETPVNIRANPSLSADIVTTTMRNETFEVIDMADDWYKVKLDDNSEAWIADFLVAVPLKMQRSLVNVRQEPSIESAIVGQVKNGETFTVLDYDKEWCKVKTINGTTGYTAQWLIELDKQLRARNGLANQVTDGLKVTSVGDSLEEHDVIYDHELFQNITIDTEDGDWVANLSLADTVAHQTKQTNEGLLLAFGSEVEEIALSQEKDVGIININLSNTTKYEVKSADNGNSLIVTIPYSTLENDAKYLENEIDLIKDIFVSSNNDDLIIKFELYKDRSYQILSDEYSDTISIKLTDTTLLGKTIVVDAGHGGYDPGAIGVTGIEEADVNLDVAVKLKELLESKGAKVLMTRAKDNHISLSSRVGLANDNQADLLISVHSNASRQKWSNGIETLYYPKDQNLSLARAVQTHLVKYLKRRDRGVVSRPRLMLLNAANMPSIIAELGFLTDKTEEKLLITDEYQDNAALAIAEALEEFLK